MDDRLPVDLLERYLEVAELDLPTRRIYEGYIRRTILPALGGTDRRKIRGPVLDTSYSRPRRCGNLACIGRPFTEHTSFPALQVLPGRMDAWQQAVTTIRAPSSSSPASQRAEQATARARSAPRKRGAD